jgi:ABC-type transport system involved in cytochrome bd biosynthesis fused ATPase/permease subunit
LLRGSLKKNLCYGAGRVTREELLRVVSDCGLDQLVAHGQGGLAMRIAENGANLSQGERVRVALARALLCKPAILLLDEADANLDLRAIRALNKVLGEFAGTAIVASHRHSSMPLCDTVWTLLDGGVQVSPATRAGAAQTATPASPQTDVAAIRVARA